MVEEIHVPDENHHLTPKSLCLGVCFIAKVCKVCNNRKYKSMLFQCSPSLFSPQWNRLSLMGLGCSQSRHSRIQSWKLVFITKTCCDGVPGCIEAKKANRDGGWSESACRMARRIVGGGGAPIRVTERGHSATC